MSDVSTASRSSRMSFGNLSSACQGAVRLMQRTGFGRVEGWVVRAGEPVLEPRPCVLRTVKLNGVATDNAARAEASLSDFELKREHIEFFAQLDQLQDGVVVKVEIAYGLPQLMVIAGPISSAA